MSAPRVALIDYGIGNLPSAAKALARAGADVLVTRDPSEIAAAEGVVLPGVGAMGSCMDALSVCGLRAPVLEAIGSGRPFLGICVGMQMLHRGSEEHGGVEGLGVFDATVVMLPDSVKKPQMQWNVVHHVGTDGTVRVLDGLDGHWFYFVHSFVPEPHNAVVGVCDYGGPITAVVERANVCGTQFHPEKSGTSGIALLSNFVRACVPARVL